MSTNKINAITSCRFPCMKQQNILKLHNFDDMKTTYRVFWSIYEDGLFGEYGEYTNKSEAIKAAHDNSFNIAGTQPHCNYIWRVKNNKGEVVAHGECRNGDPLSTTPLKT